VIPKSAIEAIIAGQKGLRINRIKSAMMISIPPNPYISIDPGSSCCKKSGKKPDHAIGFINDAIAA
jgi:hypothetical protein